MSTSAAPPASRELQRLVAVANALLRHRYLLVGVPLLAIGTAAVLGLRQARQYTSVAAVLSAQQSSSRSPTSSLAAQFGVTIPGAGSGDSPEFYADLIETRAILQPAAETPLSDDGQSLAQRLGGTAAAVERLRSATSVDIASRSGIMRISVRWDTPAEAQRVAAVMVAALERFNRERRQSRASAERRFVEQRLEESNAELRQAETRLQSFLQQNRQYANSPALAVEHERLLRTLAMRQQLVASLTQSYEQAKIDEVRDTPVITIIEEADLPLRPDPRGLAQRMALAGVIGFLLAAMFAIARDTIRRPLTGMSEELAELQSLRKTALSDLRNPIRPLRRLVRGGGARADVLPEPVSGTRVR